MALTLPNLYCTPNDLYRRMSVEGVKLRLDDRDQATGQQVTATANAAVGATTINIAALQSPLLRGSVLTFSGGGMADSLDVTLTATAALGATSLSVGALTAPVYVNSSALDDGTDLALAVVMAEACQVGTGQVKDYCCPRYQDSDLANNASEKGAAFRWALAVACRYLGRRCCRPCPKPIVEEAKEAIDEMKGVRSGNFNIADIPTRTSGWPFLSNVTVNPAYDTVKLRVEQVISEPTPTQYPQFPDWSSVFLLQW